MPHRVLIITDNPDDAETLEKMLRYELDEPFDTECVTHLDKGLARLKTDHFDAVFASFTLPDSSGIETFDKLIESAPHTTLMMLTSHSEEALGVLAVRRGAQGYLSKGHLERTFIPHSLHNTIQRKTSEEAFLNEKTRAEIALNSISDAVLCTDLAGNIDYLNIAGESMTGWSRDAARGRPLAEVFNIINGATRKPQQDLLGMVLGKDEPMALNADTILIRRDGSEAAIEDSASPIHDWAGKPTGMVIVFHDVTAAQAMATKMAYLAQHDELTKLPNRVLLNDRIAQSIRFSKRHGKQFALLFLDLDNFKYINDSLGHEMGDKLLLSVAQRLCDCVRDSDTVSRQGGDEFVILLADGQQDVGSAVVAEKILASLALPHTIDKQDMHITTSIGIAVYPTDGQDAEVLIKSADTAMYHAKKKGKNNHKFFSNDMNDRAVERQLVENNLRTAMENDELVLYYQSKVNLETGRITGAEALLRWNHADWGLTMPNRFVSVAEDCGLIVPIGRWALTEACRQAQRWTEAGLAIDSVAVNVSAMEFHEKNFVASVGKILSTTGLNARRLQLEITEGVLMRDVGAGIAILQELKNMGIQLAVDDFGTGYSSLSYLKQFPIDVLKIDQSFVHDIQSDDEEGIIASAVIGMANNLKLRVVAEGVETKVQLAFLKARQCEEGQGYLFNKPIDAAQFGTLLATGIPENVFT